MLRVAINEHDHAALPALDVDDARFVIGCDPAARVRLPQGAVRPEHVAIEGRRWRALAEVHVDGTVRAAGDAGDIGDGIELAIAGFRVRIAPAPAGTHASPPQRTESLARELMRGLLGDGAAPRLEVERGPVAGVARALPPPIATVVIGRGEESQWIILDEDLSRAHAELRRGWDGVTIRDLGSRNGTRVDGVAVTGEQRLRDGQAVALGKVVLRFRDPAERHLAGAGTPPPPPPAIAASPPTRSTWPTLVAAGIAVLAVLGLAWILAS